MKKITLKNPIVINGEEIKEVTYDANEISGTLFTEAEARKKAAGGMKNTSISAAAEFDIGLHTYIGYAAIIAVNPQYDFSDLERIKGRDVLEIMKIGRNFMLGSDQDSQGNDSDEPTAITQGSITPAQQSSQKKE